MMQPHFFYFPHAAAADKSLRSCPTLSLLEYLGQKQ